MEEYEMLQVLQGEFYDKMKVIKEIVPRDVQFPKVENKIKVAIGMRRVGKTYFLYHTIRKMLDEGIEKKSILYINFEDDRILSMNEKSLGKLVDAFYTLYPENHDRKCYLFFDEIQNVENWPLVVRRLYDTKNVEIFLTGSSSKLLSKEISTSLRGRSLAVEIWPYNFHEFLRAKKIEIDESLYDKKTMDRLTQAFHLYLKEGGFPEVISYEQESRKRTLQEYVDVTLFRDIIERHESKNPSLVKYMILSMIHNVGKPFAVNKFYNDVRSQGYQTGKDVLYEYGAFIEDAYLAFFVPLYSESIRKSKVNPKKIYAIDSGLVRAVTFEYEKDLGRLFENVIFLELRRLGYKISYLRTFEDFEIDFLVETSRGEKKLIQVALDVATPSTQEREERALHAGMKELGLEGCLITLDSYLRTGIKNLSIP